MTAMQKTTERPKIETLRQALCPAADGEGEQSISREMTCSPAAAGELSAYSRLALDLWERYSGNPPVESIDGATWFRFRRAVLNERCFPPSTVGRLRSQSIKTVRKPV